MKKSIFLLIICSTMLYCGAWTQKKDGYFLKIATSFLETDSEFNFRGTEKKLLEERFIYKHVKFSDVSVHFYSEFGWTDNITFSGYLPFKVYTSTFTQTNPYSGQKTVLSNSGFSDLYLQVKYGILKNPLAVSVQTGVKFPLGYAKFPENGVPALGTAETDFDLMVLSGLSLYPLPAYLSGSIGYRHRTGRLNDEYLFQLETGYTVSRFFLKIQMDGVKNISSPPDIYGAPIQTPLAGGGGELPDIILGDQNIFKLVFSGMYEVKSGLGISTEIFHILAGKNTITGTTFSLGLVLYSF